MKAILFTLVTFRSALIRKSFLSSQSTNAAANAVKFKFFEEKSATMVEVTASKDKSALDIAIENNIDIEGACGGQMACSTCHVVLSKKLFDKLPKKEEEEDDMLDLAWGVTETSRLCCQIKVSDVLADEVFTVPKDTNNMF